MIKLYILLFCISPIVTFCQIQKVTIEENTLNIPIKRISYEHDSLYIELPTNIDCTYIATLHSDTYITQQTYKIKHTFGFSIENSGNYWLSIKPLSKTNNALLRAHIEVHKTKENTYPNWIIIFPIVVVLIGIAILIKIKTCRNLQSNLEVDFEKRTEELRLKNIELEKINITKNRIFSIIGHDLKSPLNALIGFSDLLLDKYDTLNNEKRLKFITIVNSSSKLMYDMLINLLDWARSQSGEIKYEPNNFELHKIVRIAHDYNQYNAHKKNITIDIHIETDIEVFVDYNMIMTVLRNILSNAIKYSNHNGTIHIYCELLETNNVILAIKDNGIGMNQFQIDNIFNPETFNSTPGTENEQGTGLGLLLCREFIMRLGGELKVISKPQNGSTFLITLPRY